jgi:hypothetical protein
MVTLLLRKIAPEDFPGQFPKIGAVKSVNCSGMAVIVEMHNAGDPGVRAEVVALVEYALNFRTRTQGARRHS